MGGVDCFLVSFQDYENILKLIVEMVAQLCEYTKNHWFVHSKKGTVWDVNKVVTKFTHQFQKVIYYYIFITPLKWQNFRNERQISGYQRLRFEEEKEIEYRPKRATQRILQLIELLSILTVVVNTQSTFDKLYRTKYTHTNEDKWN